MNSQLYTAASGLLVEERRVELIANNLANLSTSGFRAQRSFSAVYEGAAREAGPLPRAANKAVALAGAFEVPGPGPLHPSGRMLDAALEPGTVIALETAAGRRYSRAASFEVSVDGELTDAQGNRVLDPSGQKIGGLTPAASLTPDGRIVEIVEDEEQERGRLMVLRDPEAVLRPGGDNLLEASGRDAALQPVDEPSLKTAFVEGSATEPLRELVLLVEAQRAFESYQKLIQLTMNEVNRKAVNEIAG